MPKKGRELPRQATRLVIFQVLALVLLMVCNSSAFPDDSAVVLMYHRFGEDRYPSTSVRIEQFEAQLAVLGNEGFSVLPLSTLLAALENHEPLPPNAVVITVDDAYRSVYEVAYPRLRAYGFPFTVFVATDPVDRGSADFMTWLQMREMAGGGASFANHGASHSSMIALLEGESGPDRIRRVLADFEKGAARLSSELEPVPSVFAYPYGEYDLAIADHLRNSGTVAFGQHSGAVGRGSDRRALPRFPIAEAYSDLDEFRTKISSRPMPVVNLVPWDPVVTDRRPEIEITLDRTDARLEALACFVSGQGRVAVRWIEDGRRFAVSPEKPLGLGRQRVNCTAPAPDGRYLWFSHPWFVMEPGR